MAHWRRHGLGQAAAAAGAAFLSAAGVAENAQTDARDVLQLGSLGNLLNPKYAGELAVAHWPATGEVSWLWKAPRHTLLVIRHMPNTPRMGPGTWKGDRDMLVSGLWHDYGVS